MTYALYLTSRSPGSRVIYDEFVDYVIVNVWLYCQERRLHCFVPTVVQEFTKLFTEFGSQLILNRKRTLELEC